MRARGEAPFISGPERGTPAPETSALAQYLFYAVILLLLTLAGWLYLSTIVRVDALAVEIYQLEQQKEQLRRDVVQRGARLAELESLSRVRAEAERLGFTARSAEQQLTVPELPDSATAGGPADATPGSENLWHRVSEFWSGGSGANTSD